MNELNMAISGIIKKYQAKLSAAVPQLFQLMASQPEENHPNIKQTILYSMEDGHEWGNILKYVIKWKPTGFEEGFIKRMRQRLNEPPLTEKVDQIDCMKRLVQKYWKTRSPKKEERVYKEPIDIKKLMKNAQSLTPKDQYAILPAQKNEKPLQAIEKPALEQRKEVIPEKKEITFAKLEIIGQGNQQSNKSANIWRGDSFGAEQQDSNSVSNLPEKKEKADPLGTVTGRPPILKKKSVFENNIKITAPNNDRNEEKKDESSKGRMATSKIFNIMKKIQDRKEVKSNENWQNFGKIKESAPNLSKVNQQFPADKFNFGSNKKGSAEQETKKISISPIKYDPNLKLVKIIRNQPKQEKKIESLHEFSFASSQQKESKARQLEQPYSFRPTQAKQSEQKLEQRFIFHDNVKESDKDEVLSGSESFKKLKEVAETPVFMADSKNRRSSGGIKSQEAFEVDEVLNIYHADVKLRYFMKEIEGRNGADTMTIFQDEFSRFLKNPESFMT